MASSASASSECNLAGAVIFVVYVVSALFFTGVIICVLLYSPGHRSAPTTSRKYQGFSHENKLQIFAALSVLSFAVLSYNMMSFLIFSYEAWALGKGIKVPSRIFGRDGLFDLQQRKIHIYVWEWLTSSTLFRDFAETICGNSARYWWTQEALLVTMAWSFFMSIEGVEMLSYNPNLFLSLMYSFVSRPKKKNPRALGISSDRTDPSCIVRTKSFLPSNASDTNLGSGRYDVDAKASSTAAASCDIFTVHLHSPVLGRNLHVRASCPHYPATPLQSSSSSRRSSEKLED